MKLIIDISEYNKEWIGNLHFIPEELKFEIGNAIMDGTPFDSVIEDMPKTQMIDKSNFDERQHKVDTDTAYECGRASVLSAIEDIKAEIEKRADDYLSSGSYDGDLYNGAYRDALYWCFDLLDKHISGKESQ